MERAGGGLVVAVGWVLCRKIRTTLLRSERLSVAYQICSSMKNWYLATVMGKLSSYDCCHEPSTKRTPYATVLFTHYLASLCERYS